MSTTLIPQDHVQELREHIYVRSATARAVSFTAEFKEYAYKELQKGKTIRQIFTEAGFDIEKLGLKRLENFRAQIEKMAQRDGGFVDLRCNNCRKEDESDEVKLRKRIRQLEHQLAYLQQENEFFKKIKEIEEKQVK